MLVKKGQTSNKAAISISAVLSVKEREVSNIRSNWKDATEASLSFVSYTSLLFCHDHCVLGQQATSWPVWHIQILYSHHGVTQTASSLCDKNPHTVFTTEEESKFIPNIQTPPPPEQFTPTINNSTANKMDEND